MADHFSLRCHPSKSLRFDETAQLMALTQTAFRIRKWTDHDSEAIEATPENINNLISEFKQVNIDQTGVSLLFAGETDAGTVLFNAVVGGDKWALNFFSVNFAQTRSVPEKGYFRQSIRLTRPFEAYVLDFANDDNLRESRQGRIMEKVSFRDGPLAVHWIHYMNAELVTRFGGMQYCLTLPAYSVERFCDGILIQLTHELFDPNNQSHLEIQRRAMGHLGLL